MSNTDFNDSPPVKHEQPKCGTCNHMASFHTGERRRCFVVGCGCEAWSDTAAPVSVA